jgi:hypothetical protein
VLAVQGDVQGVVQVLRAVLVQGCDLKGVLKSKDICASLWRVDLEHFLKLLESMLVLWFRSFPAHTLIAQSGSFFSSTCLGSSVIPLVNSISEICTVQVVIANVDQDQKDPASRVPTSRVRKHDPL